MNDPRQPATHTALRGHAKFRLVALLMGFGFQIMVVKILSPGNYATYAVLVAALLVGERFLSFGTDRTVLRFVPALLLSRDRKGLRSLASRLGFLRALGVLIFVLALASSAMFHLRIAPEALPVTTTIAFGAWFVAYTLLKEADAVAQSLIMHQRAALIAAAEVFLRIGSLWLIYFYLQSVNVETVILLHAITSTSAVAGLMFSIWFYRRRSMVQSALTAENEIDDRINRQVPVFAMSAYASTLSFLISSPGVIRLVAKTGLDIYALAAFSFVQGLAISLSSALPGQLILPSLESVAARMAGSGNAGRIFPALSLLFKIELTCVLSIIVATAVAGSQLVGALSRPEYAPYYYVLPALMVGLLFQTIYRLLEIVGSAHLKYRIFLALWPLSIGAIIALYVTVGRWGLISVLVVPIVEIVARVTIVTFAFRRLGILNALDPARSLRLVLSAAIVLVCSLLVTWQYGESLGEARLLIAAGGVTVFLSSLMFLRPLSKPEYETLSRFLPASWRLPVNFARRLAHL